MNWTSPADLRAQVQRLWDKGMILTSMVKGDSLFPQRLNIKKPSSDELTDRFQEVRAWIADLRKERYYRIVMRELRHQVIGTNSIPHEIWVDTFENALSLIGKNGDAMRFSDLMALISERQPPLESWLAKRPLKALELFEVWPRILDVIDWIQTHPRPNVYLRQMDIPGVHTKFIEAHRAIFIELLDLVLPPDGFDSKAAGVGQFSRRYGFLEKPLRIRFRILDPDLAVLPGGGDQDIEVNQEAFNRMDLMFAKIFITENEINFLSFPQMKDSMVIFGAGYGFEMLARTKWLDETYIYYWGDIDTHGFAILDQLRGYFPHAKSFLMDRKTFMNHEAFWGVEPQPAKRDLKRLNTEERDLYDDIRLNRIGNALRLEQERIGFHWVSAALRTTPFEKA